MMMSTTIATPATSSSPSKSASPFEEAKRGYKWTFAAYVASLLLAAALTYLAGKSADRVAGLAQADADRRIAESSAAAELARAEAARANEGAAKATLAAEEARTANLATETKLEAERKMRLELEANISPRLLTDSTGAGDALKPFAGMRYDLMYLFEHETTRTTAQIADMLDLPRWKLGKNTRYMNDLFLETHEGVLIEANRGDSRAEEAARTLAAALSSRGIKATVGRAPARSDNPEPSPIVINVGLKPTTYFSRHRL